MDEGRTDVLSVASRITAAFDVCNEAVRLDNEDAPQKALDKYLEGIQMLGMLMREIGDASILADVTAKRAPYIARAKQIDAALRVPAPAAAVVGGGGNRSEMETFVAEMESLFVEPSAIDDTFDSIVGMHQIKADVQSGVMMQMHFPHLYGGARQPTRSILMYGPPGTGKTTFARAIAKQSDRVFADVRCSSIIDKWIGDASKKVAALEEAVRRKSPCVVFFDEFDHLCRDRATDGGASEVARGATTELLKSMEKMATFEGVLVVGATNLPEFIDPAGRRRFSRILYIPLPDALAKTEMFRRCSGTFGVTHSVDDHTFAEMARLPETEFYSGSTIKNAVQLALDFPIQDLGSATSFLVDPTDGKWVAAPRHENEGRCADCVFWDARDFFEKGPCTACGVAWVTWQDVVEHKRTATVKCRLMTAEDLANAVRETPASSKASEIAELEAWASSYSTRA